MKANTLVILTPGFPADENDGSSVTFPQIFTRNLKVLNPALNIIVLAFQYPFTDEPYKWHGVNVIPFNGRNKGKLNRLLIWKAVWTTLKKIMSENHVIGFLNLWLGECALIGKYASKKYHVKNYTWLLGQDAKKNNKYFSLLGPKPEMLIALSDFISDEFFKNFKIRPARTIPPGIDKKMFTALPFNRTIDIMGAGSLIPLKRYDLFIELISKMVKIKPGLVSIICGEGIDHNKLQELITVNKLQDHIHLVGKVSHQEVLNFMRSTKIFLHPSSYEGFSTVCCEALYSGAHVVSFCKPMHKDFDHFHIVETEKDMQHNLEELLQDPSLDHTGVITYPIEEICEKVLSLYQ
ncbi:MAG: glycosyltransferase [Ferruginibacter sp.]